MGQTDKQFQAFLRQIVGRLKTAMDAPDLETVKVALTLIIDDLQHSIED